MPNWCRNEVRIFFYQEDSPELEEILDFVKETTTAYRHRLERMAIQDKKLGTSRCWSGLNQRELFDFHSIVPYPVELAARDLDYYTLSEEEYVAKYPPCVTHRDGIPLTVQELFRESVRDDPGYEWRLRHWGAKWNTTGAVWVKAHSTFHFDTAWGPVFPVISALHQRFPLCSISYEYYERGMGVIGGCEYIPEDYFDPSDYTPSQVPDLESAMKRGQEPPPAVWAAGQAYNFWSMDYMGFKGG